MADQKIENLLNLAAGSTNSEKEKSENLGVGFDPQTDTWEIIVRYSGDILSLTDRYPGIRIVPLLGQYAIVAITTLRWETKIFHAESRIAKPESRNTFGSLRSLP